MDVELLREIRRHLEICWVGEDDEPVLCVHDTDHYTRELLTLLDEIADTIDGPRTTNFVGIRAAASAYELSQMIRESRRENE